MILLDAENKVIVELLQSRFESCKSGQKCDKLSFTLVDFDGTSYLVNNEKNRNIIRLSITLLVQKDLASFNVLNYLKTIYGVHLSSETEPNYFVTLEFDVTQLPDDYEQLAHKAGLLRRNCFAGVLEQMFDKQQELEKKPAGQSTGPQAVLHFRTDETIYLQASHDRVTFIFSTVFKEADDMVIGKLILQELGNFKNTSIRSPQVLYSFKTPPAELSNSDAVTGDNIIYITIVLQPFHMKRENRQRTIDMIQMLRNLMHYHIKCCKANMRSQMRCKYTEWLKVLNAARPECLVSCGINTKSSSPSSGSALVGGSSSSASNV